MSKPFRRLALVVFAAAFARVVQADLADRELILIPILSAPIRGEDGSLWETEAWLMRLQPDVLIGPIADRDCLPPCGPPPPPLPPPGEAVRPPLFRTEAGEPNGVLMFVSRGRLHDVALSVRVADVTRRVISSGLAIPIVSERDLRASVHLLNVPATAETRIRLRIYEPLTTSPVRVLVRVFDTYSIDTLVDEFDVELIQPPQPALPGWPYPVRPASADVSLPVGEYQVAGPIRIEILPLEQELKLWAFATITNNVTQEVTAVFP